MNEKNVKCVNVFKTASQGETIREFTNRWVELINQAEQRKSQMVNVK
ncbi:MAG: hypothetical protein J6K43_06255 [Lachnospiraceae bacterium]|nr:hypothetical protein [Lachnospiraceae bacterium]